jgi:prepilin-type N-terminal cleavage/methylation domain-containing protein
MDPVRAKAAAFTLIELLIVVAIIGILAAIAVPNFLNAQVRAKVARVESDHRTISVAMESYFTDHGAYPPEAAHSANRSRGFTFLTTPVAYLNSALEDPFGMKYVQADRENLYDTVYEFMVTCLQGEKNNMFNIESVGPDGIDSFLPTPAYPSHPPDFEFYDPTNGLRSYGEIIRAGGVYIPRWYRERKGGRRTTGRNWI